MDKELLLKIYESDVDLYKFYLDTAIKLAVFVFAVTGAIVSYCLTNRVGLIRYALGLPILMNLGLTILYIRSIGNVNIMVEDHDDIEDKLGIETHYDFSPLPNTILLFAVLYGLMTLGLVALLIGSVLGMLDSRSFAGI